MNEIPTFDRDYLEGVLSTATNWEARTLTDPSGEVILSQVIVVPWGDRSLICGQHEDRTYLYGGNISSDQIQVIQQEGFIVVTEFLEVDRVSNMISQIQREGTYQVWVPLDHLDIGKFI